MSPDFKGTTSSKLSSPNGRALY